RPRPRVLSVALRFTGTSRTSRPRPCYPPSGITAPEQESKSSFVIVAVFRAAHWPENVFCLIQNLLHLGQQIMIEWLFDPFQNIGHVRWVGGASHRGGNIRIPDAEA